MVTEVGSFSEGRLCRSHLKNTEKRLNIDIVPILKYSMKFNFIYFNDNKICFNIISNKKELSLPTFYMFSEKPSRQ